MKTNVALIIVFDARGQKEKETKKGLVYIYLPQMHMLSFGVVFFATPLQHLL
jgi:hypothetical protein